jgi:hypothetical protein
MAGNNRSSAASRIVFRDLKYAEFLRFPALFSISRIAAFVMATIVVWVGGGELLSEGIMEGQLQNACPLYGGPGSRRIVV